MARLITREKLCEAIKISDSSLRKYISRKNIKEQRKGWIDLDLEKNKACIINYASRKGIDCEAILYNEEEKQEPKKTNPTVSNKTNQKEVANNSEKKVRKEKISHAELQRIKIEKEVEKLEVETRLKNLELEKKKAKVLPIDFVIDWSSLNIRGIFGENINFGYSMIEQMCNELDADIEIKLRFKKMFKQGFTDILKEGIKNQKPEAIAQAKEYSLLTKW